MTSFSPNAICCGRLERISPIFSGLIREHVHGAASGVGATDSPFPSRYDSFDLVVINLWTDREGAASHIAGTRAFHDAMDPRAAGLVYVDALDQDDRSRVPEAYGPNYSAVKAAYDPGNRLRRNQNIQPKSRAAAV